MNYIAHQVGRNALGYSALMTDTPSPFPFFALPWELRRQVLQYTDLITPFHEFQWSPRSGYSVIHAMNHEGRCDPEDYHGSLF